MPKLPASRSLTQDLVAASRVLAAHEVLDAYGHVSARSDRRPDRFFMSRSRAPALVTAADMMQLDADSEPLPGERRKGFIERLDRKSTRLNSSHLVISYAVFCLKKKN